MTEYAPFLGRGHIRVDHTHLIYPICRNLSTGVLRTPI
jgi:hypothetical protein